MSNGFVFLRPPIDRSTTTKQHRPINSSITTKLKRLEECVTFRVSKSPFKYIFGRWCETKNQVYNKKTTTTNLISDSYQSKEPDHDHHLMCTPEEGKIQPFFWIPQLKQPVWAVKHISGHKSFDFRPIFRSYRVPIHGRNAYSKPVEAISRETILFTCRATIQVTDYNITSFWVNVCLSCERAHYVCMYLE